MEQSTQNFTMLFKITYVESFQLYHNFAQNSTHSIFYCFTMSHNLFWKAEQNFMHLISDSINLYLVFLYSISSQLCTHPSTHFVSNKMIWFTWPSFDYILAILLIIELFCTREEMSQKWEDEKKKKTYIWMLFFYLDIYIWVSNHFCFLG